MALKSVVHYSNLGRIYILVHEAECFLRTIIFPVVLYGYETWSLKTAVHYSTLGRIYLLTPLSRMFIENYNFSFCFVRV
jgi:hypothetical protein